MKLIIYPTDIGITIITPAPQCSLTDEETALKDVPTGVKYRLIEYTDLPDNREFRNAWEADFSTFDGVGA
jgi:hypothetical protein